MNVVEGEWVSEAEELAVGDGFIVVNEDRHFLLLWAEVGHFDVLGRHSFVISELKCLVRGSLTISVGSKGVVVGVVFNNKSGKEAFSWVSFQPGRNLEALLLAFAGLLLKFLG